MNDKDREVLLKIHKHVKKAISYCENIDTQKAFEDNSQCVEACVFNLMQIGELAKQCLSDELKADITSIPWKQLYGMRNRIVHGYDGVDMTIVWATIKMIYQKMGVFNLMQIGELAKQCLSDELKSDITSIPWKQLYGMRNRIVHGYDGVDMTIVWATIKKDLPILDKELTKMSIYR